jgi:hypothetical protein
VRTTRLARISHQLSAAATDPGMSTALRSVGRLDALSGTPAASSRRAPCGYYPLGPSACAYRESPHSCRRLRPRAPVHLPPRLQARLPILEQKERKTWTPTALGLFDGCPVFSLMGVQAFMEASMGRIGTPIIPAHKPDPFGGPGLLGVQVCVHKPSPERNALSCCRYSSPATRSRSLWPAPRTSWNAFGGGAIS